MQLQAGLQSFFLHCGDSARVAVKVLFTTSSPAHEGQYQRLRTEYGAVEFIRESGFKEDLLAALAGHPYILFLVDDNLFVRDFVLEHAVESLKNQPGALGFSLRLGENTTYCYMLNREQKLPAFTTLEHNVLWHEWVDAACDFGYPLEVSSSLYRTKDLLPLLHKIDFRNPNTLELLLDANKTLYAHVRSRLLCFQKSVAFCNPLNIVQTMWINRAGSREQYTAEKLSSLFDQGLRIDVEALADFVPAACHQEIEFQFVVRRPGQA